MKIINDMSTIINIKIMTSLIFPNGNYNFEYLENKTCDELREIQDELLHLMVI